MLIYCTKAKPYLSRIWKNQFELATSKIQAYGLWKDDSQVVEEQPRVEVMIQNFTISGRFDL